MDMSGLMPYNHQQYSPPGSPNNAASPTDSNNGAPRKQHTRTYQACEPCRSRKVKCDLGSVEAPSDPPCARCRREHKDCTFATTRRKNNKRTRSDLEQDDNLSKRARSDGANGTPGNRVFLTQSPMAQAGQDGITPLSQPHSPGPEAYRQISGAMRNETYDGQNALGVLVDAAQILAAPFEAKPKAGDPDPDTLDPANLLSQYPPEVIQEAVNVWSNFRFVAAGWFTAEEGMKYVLYFYEMCLKFTPITIPDYKHPSKHAILLDKEPFLVITILVIASRFMTLSGQGGQRSRPAFIHDKLFEYLKKSCSKLSWAQEQLGGGFAGGGKVNAASANDPLFRYGNRSISTVESLLLLTEWAPRALHFPPGDDDAQLLVQTMQSRSHTYNQHATDNPSEFRSWLEPAWRSGRMIWMLLHSAFALGMEIGLFNDVSLEDLLRTTKGVPANEIHEFYARKVRTRDMFSVFYIQTCGRLELIGNLPPRYLESLFPSVIDDRIKDAVAEGLRRFDNNEEQPHHILQLSQQNFSDAERASSFFWQEITAIMKSGNQTMFGNPTRTRRIISSDEYRKYIVVYEPILQQWRDALDQCALVSDTMRSILLIEYEYVRIYIYALPLQAFVERVVAATPSKQNLDFSNGNTRNDSLTNNAVAPEHVRDWMQHDESYIEKLVGSCQNLLKIVSEGSIPAKNVKHFTMRIYFRIMTGAVHLLKFLGPVRDFIVQEKQKQKADRNYKSFIVGAWANNVARSLELLRNTMAILREHIVDDVHIGTTFSEMIDTVARQMLPRLVRFTQNAAGNGKGNSRAHSATPSAMPSPAMHHSKMYPTMHHPHSGAASYSGTGIAGYTTPAMNGDVNFWDTFEPMTFLDNIGTYDSTNGTTAMPPPDWNSGNFNVSAAEDMGGNDNTTMAFGMNGSGHGPEFISLDLTNLANMGVNGHTNEVTSTQFGVAVNGADLLDQFMGPPANYTPYAMPSGHGMSSRY